MEILDVTYDRFTITEPFLIDLLNSPSVQRMKGISQYGLPPEYYHRPGFSRYEHCVGVMLLLRKLDAGMIEQAAGLLHDISHTAFSHLIDWVMGDTQKENYQDSIHQQVLEKSEIPAISRKHGVSMAEIAEPEKYCLLEQPAPRLCADRIDYALKEFHYWANPQAVAPLVADLKVWKDRIAFGSQQSAKLFGETYLKLQREHWGDTETMVRYALFSELLKHALAEGYITKNDFSGDDEFVLRKLRGKDANIDERLELLKGRLALVPEAVNPQFNFKKKFRWIDPEFIQNGSLLQLSHVDVQYRQLIEHDREKNKAGIAVNLRNHKKLFI